MGRSLFPIFFSLVAPLFIACEAPVRIALERSPSPDETGGDDSILPDGESFSFTVADDAGMAAGRGNAVVDGGAGAIVLGGATKEAEGTHDMFLARYDAARTVVWERRFGSGSDDFLTAVARDETGALYAVGYTYGVMGETAYGNADIVIAKYDGAGSPLWIRQYGSAGEDIALSCALIGPALYIGGATDGALFPGDLPRKGDGFILRLDRNGELIDAASVGSSETDRVTALFPGGGDTLYAAGVTGGSLHDNLSFGNGDGFLSNFSLSLTRRWTRQFGTSGSDIVLSGVADDRHIALAGMTFGAFDDQINDGNYDAFLLLFDLNGDRIFSRQHGNDGPDAFYGVAFAEDGSIIAAGSSFGPLFTHPAGGGYEIVAVRYDRAGNPQNTLQYGTAGDDGAFAVTARSGGAVLTGARAEKIFLMDIKW